MQQSGIDNKISILTNKNCSQLDFPGIKIQVFGALKSATADFYNPNQVHETTIVEVSSVSDPRTKADASYTYKRHTPIAVRTADCLPILLFTRDTENPVMAIHAGWRGFAKGILSKSIDMFADKLLKNTDIYAFIGPAISSQAFEVGPEVIEATTKYAKKLNVDFSNFTLEGHGDRLHFDLQLAACQVMTNLGIKPLHISVLRECTFDNIHWHSYRREKKLTGHNFTVIEKI